MQRQALDHLYRTTKDPRVRPRAQMILLSDVAGAVHYRDPGTPDFGQTRATVWRHGRPIDICPDRVETSAAHALTPPSGTNLGALVAGNASFPDGSPTPLSGTS
jgi:hypothetical protein